MPWGAAIGAVGAIGSALASGNTTGNPNYNAPALQSEQQAVNLISGVPLPTINTTPYGTYATPQTYTATNYTPWLGSATQTALSPQDMANEAATLGQLQQFANGSWLPTDQLALNAAQFGNESAASNANAQAQQSLQSRGEGGGGASTVAQMMGQQQAENADQQTGASLAQAALQRQLNAITGAGNMEATMTGQDYTQSQNNANILNNFNTQVQQLNTNAAANAAANQNAANLFNLQNQQAVGQQNTNIQNQNLDRTNLLAQQGFSNQMSKAEDQGNALMGLAVGQGQAQAAAAQEAQAAASGTRASVGLGLTGMNIGSSGNNSGNTSGNTSGSTSTNSGSSFSLPNVLSNIFGGSTSSGGIGGSGGSGLTQGAMDSLGSQAGWNIAGGFAGG